MVCWQDADKLDTSSDEASNLSSHRSGHVPSPRVSPTIQKNSEGLARGLAGDVERAAQAVRRRRPGIDGVENQARSHHLGDGADERSGDKPAAHSSQWS